MEMAVCQDEAVLIGHPMNKLFVNKFGYQVKHPLPNEALQTLKNNVVVEVGMNWDIMCYVPAPIFSTYNQSLHWPFVVY